MPAKTTGPMVSIITPFRTNLDQVRRCVDSVKKQKYGNIEMILVSDQTTWHDEDRRFIGVHAPNAKGPGEKRNAGIRKARGDIFFFLDSDCTVRPETLTNLVRLFEEKGMDAISGKPLVPKEGNLLGIATGLEYEDRFDQMGEGFVDVAATTCFAVRADKFRKFGGFRDYSTGEATGEDWDFSRRFTAAGFSIYHTNRVQVFHHHTNDSIKKWFSRRVEHSGYRVEHKHKHGQIFEQYFSLRFFVETSLLFSVPVALRAYKNYGRIEVFALPIFATLRNIAWLLGMTKALMHMK
jgi:GT2 family glycosyltransferase